MTTTPTAVTAAPAPAPPAPEPDAAGLAAREAAIADALDAAGDQVDPFLAARAREDLAAVRSRLALGADRTVVALVGGTGSGKSSLFNAISGLIFADVGALRPTTDEAAACVWGVDAEALLDFLHVAPTRRIQRESVLDGDHERALHGMVLLDLPDHDSIALDHAEQVDRLLPLVDVLVWVVDPQKYADNVLHERYLRALRGRQESMLVLVNQADTIPTGAVDQVREDVSVLLAADGLHRVEVLATSALEHTGIDAVRDRLARAVARPSMVARTASAEMDAVRGRLAPAVAAAEPALPPATEPAAELARAAGAEAVAASIRTAVARTAPAALAAPEAPAPATVAAVRDGWLARATAGLPPRWARAVEAAVAPPEQLGEATAAAVRAVELPSQRSARALRWTLGAAALALLAVVYVVLGLGQGMSPAAVVVPALAGAAAAGALLGGARSARAQDAEAAARRYAEEAAARTAEVAEECLVRPAAAVLARHRLLREAVRG
ncbi:GTPase [Georgenia sp. AZ-5]|uniref:GTPase n=1 Tax=Georgenia sp. AZ-5 TaxID=3367526 RepID=UPI003754296D